MRDRIRVLVAKIGLDGHDVGARVVARGLVDAGMEVVYTGLRRTPEEIVRTAVEEDVDVVAVSILSGSHLALLPRLRKLMMADGLHDIPLIVGGIIPDGDVPAMKEAGVDAVFHPGSTTLEIAEYISGKARQRSG